MSGGSVGPYPQASPCTILVIAVGSQNLNMSYDWPVREFDQMKRVLSRARTAGHSVSWWRAATTGTKPVIHSATVCPPTTPR